MIFKEGVLKIIEMWEFSFFSGHFSMLWALRSGWKKGNYGYFSQPAELELLLSWSWQCPMTILSLKFQSLIVKYRCKLELWDDDEGLEKGAKPDLVIDRSSRTNLGRNKYVDSLADEDEYKHLDEKISSYRWDQYSVFVLNFVIFYRCTCRESTFG